MNPLCKLITQLHCRYRSYKITSFHVSSVSGQTFKSNNYRNNHEKMKHKGVSKYRCSSCGKNCADAYSLKVRKYINWEHHFFSSLQHRKMGRSELKYLITFVKYSERSVNLGTSAFLFLLDPQQDTHTRKTLCLSTMWKMFSWVATIASTWKDTFSTLPLYYLR